MSQNPAEKDQVRDETTEKLSDEGVGATMGEPDTFEYVNSTWPHHGGLSWLHLLGCGRGGSWWCRFR